jgi:hypothetical protein
MRFARHNVTRGARKSRENLKEKGRGKNKEKFKIKGQNNAKVEKIRAKRVHEGP